MWTNRCTQCRPFIDNKHSVCTRRIFSLIKYARRSQISMNAFPSSCIYYRPPFKNTCAERHLEMPCFHYYVRFEFGFVLAEHKIKARSVIFVSVHRCNKTACKVSFFFQIDHMALRAFCMSVTHTHAHRHNTPETHFTHNSIA